MNKEFPGKLIRDYINGWLKEDLDLTIGILDEKIFKVAKQLYEKKKTPMEDIWDKLGKSKRTLYIGI